MRKFLIGSAAFLGLTAAASAADLARPAPPMVPVFTWTGLYVGANAGYIWSEGNIGDHCFTGGTGVFFGAGCQQPQFVTSPESSNWLAGGQIGYNYQFRGWGGGSWVFGAEADLQFTDLSRTNATFDPAAFLVGGAGPYARTSIGTAEIDWFGTVRGRLGFAWDRLLVYGTAGAIFANVTTSHFNQEAFPAPGAVTFSTVSSHDSIVPGWIAGGGFEYAFTNNLSLKVEGMYYELQQSHAGGREFVNNNFNAPSGFRTGTDIDHTGFLVRGGINWRFWGM
jgi:outer membrane immunogenic protein